MAIPGELYLDHPVRPVAAGDVVVAEGERSGTLFVVGSGEFEVTRQGSTIARITEPGSVIGEGSVLLDTPHGATVTAATEGTVHVVSDVDAFLAGDAALEVARMLAARLNRLVAYIADVKTQYGGAGGHLGMLDEILSELTFGAPPAAEPGSEREPDPYY